MNMLRIRIIVPFFLLFSLASRTYGVIQVTGGLTKEFEVRPGETYEGSIEIKNPDDAPREVKAYQTDYFFYADGRALYGEPGLLSRSNARWITVSPSQVVIPAGETVYVHFSLQVPDDATMIGTYWSNIMVEPVPETSPESSLAGSAEPGVGIRQTIRYAVQVVTHIGTTGGRALKFVKVGLKLEDGRRIFNIDAENSGERWLRGAAWIELFDSLGVSRGRFEGNRQRLYPGTSARFSIDLTDAIAATYKALIIVDCGGDDVFGANVGLNIKE